MQPSSLIFLVIIAVWAAYFVQFWVRRREHLATAQSVDQFSETMRVLERRSPLPATDLSTPAPRSYAVSPARAVRAQVLVKRADTTTFTMAPSGVVAPGAAPTAAGWDQPADVDEDGHTWDVDAAPQVRPARAVRGLTLLAALALVIVSLPLAAFGAIPWLAVPVALVGVAGAVVWLRSAVAAEQSARRQAHRGAVRAARTRTERPREAAAERHAHEPAARSAAHRETTTRVEAATSAPASTSDSTPASSVAAPRHEDLPDRPVRPELYDVQEVERDLAAPRVAPAAEVSPQAASAPHPLVDEDDIPITWDPVPVPRPTYTMKSRATRPAPTSADLVGDADTEYASHEQEPVRRVAGA